VISLVLIIEAWPLIGSHPFHLAYFNRASQIVFQQEFGRSQEIDYWGVGVTRSLLQELVAKVEPGSTVAVVPTLHQFQAEEYRRQSPLLRQHQIKVIDRPSEIDVEKNRGPEIIIVFQRLADLSRDDPLLTVFENDDTYEQLGSTKLGDTTLAVIARRKL